MTHHVVAASLALSGCASMAEYDWQQRPSHPALRPYHLVIPEAVMDNACGRPPHGYVAGCAVRIPSENLCLIYTRARPAGWLMAHERRHCEGWDHTERSQ
jgi:hypothetical protein